MPTLVLDEPVVKKSTLVLDEEVEPTFTPRPLGGVWEQLSRLEPALSGEAKFEDLLPIEQTHRLTTIFEESDNPDTERDNINNTAFFSAVYGQEPKAIKESINEIMNQTGFNPSKATIEERGFFGKIAESFSRGDVDGDLSGIYAYEALYNGNGDVNEIKEMRRKLREREQLGPITGNIFTKRVYDSARIIPGMIRGYQDAGPTALAGTLTGAGAGLLAGLAIPTIGEEPITIGGGAVIGFKTGLTVGSMRFWYKQGAGEFAMTMIEAGYDPEVSKTIASIAALPYAAIEFLQWQQVTPGMRKATQEITQQTMKSVMKRAIARYGTTFTGEVLEEIAQEIVQIDAESLASYFSGKGIKLDPESMKANIRRVWETTKQAASAMALLPVPGMAIDIYTGQRSIVKPTLIEEVAATEPPTIGKVAEPPIITPTEGVAPAGEAPVTPAETAEQVIDRLDTQIATLRDTGKTIPKPLLAEREIARKALMEQGPSFMGVATKKLGVQPSPLPAVKQAWEMTFDEWNKARKSVAAAFRLKDGRIINTGNMHVLPTGIEPSDVAETGFIRTDIGQFLTQKQTLELIGFDSTRHMFDPIKEEPPEVTHKEYVKIALSEGKPVPPEVLAEYSDLQAKTVKLAEPVWGMPEKYQEVLDRAKTGKYHGKIAAGYANVGIRLFEEEKLAKHLGLSVDELRKLIPIKITDQDGWNLPKEPTIAELQAALPRIAKYKGEPKWIIEALAKTALAKEVGKVRQKDLLGRPILEGGVTGKQTEFLEKEKYRLPEPDIEGQIKIPEIKQPEVGVKETAVVETGMSDKQRTKYIKGIEEKVKKNPVYQTNLDAQEVMSREIEVGTYFVNKKFRGEVESAIGKYPALKFHITFDPSKGSAWDTAVQEMLGRGKEGVDETWGHLDIDEFLERVGMALEAGGETGGLNTIAYEKSLESGDPDIQILNDVKYGLESGKSIKEINANTMEWAKHYGLTKEAVSDILLPELTNEQLKTEQEKARAKDEALEVLEAERLGEKAKQTAAEQKRLKEILARQKRIISEKRTKEEQIKKLHRDIHATAAIKGLSKKALVELKKKYTGYSKLTGKISQRKITVEQLQNLLNAVQKARPKRIGHQTVLTLKTEKRIQTLKQNLTAKMQMTDAAWQDILKRETAGREPKYISAEQFITQQQSRAVLKRMHNTATLLKITNTYDEALKKDPEKANYVNKIDTQILAEEHRDPFFLESMRYYTQQSQEKTGAPIYPVYKAMIDTEQENHRTREAQLKWLEAAVGEDNFAKISGDEEALKRVSDYIDSKSYLENRPEMPKDITPTEIKFAETIERILKAREIQSRLGKFFRWYDLDFPETGEGAMADYGRYKKEIRKAVDIYDTQGEEELVRYLETQEWGIIHSGYDPKELLLRKIQLYTPGVRAVGKGHIQISNAVEFHEQERTILHRLNSYMRQMDTLSYTSPLINTFVQLYEDNAEKFSNWQTVKSNVELFLNELKHYTAEKSPTIRLIKRLFSQAAQALLENSPSITLYNMVEGIAFGADKSIYFDPRNVALTPQDEEYLETYVQQQRAMLEEYYFINEKALPGLEGLNRLARQLSLTSRSDVFSRYQTFWAKINQVRRALELPTFDEQVSAMKLKDYSLLEQHMAMTIWARDGADTMARYVARVESDNVHGLYERSQRSPGEMGSGAIFTNLMNFPRMYAERMARNIYEIFDPQVDAETRYRAAKTVLSAIVGGSVIGLGVGLITGRRRNPYNPLEILGWRFGGLVSGGMEKVSGLINTTFEMFSGDEITQKRARDKWPAAFTSIPEMFVPFYANVIRAIEKATDIKYIDRNALRWIREQIDKDYKRRPDAYKFNKKGIINAVQYILIGRSVDVEEQKNTGRTSRRRGLQRRSLRR